MQTSLLSVLNEIASVSGDKDKLSLLRHHINASYGPDLLLILNYAYSPRIKFYIKAIPDYLSKSDQGVNWKEVSQQLDQLSKRQITGRAAIDYLQIILEQLHPDDATIVKRIIGKDLKIGMGATSINKVVPNLIPDTPYMGAVSYKKDKAEKLFKKYGKLALQTKMDGRYCNAILSEEGVQLTSRSGEETMLYDALFARQLADLAALHHKGVLTGELTIPGIDRYQSNGIINSLITLNKKSAAGVDITKEVERFQKEHMLDWKSLENQILFTVWDFVSLEGYNLGLDETPYADRLSNTRLLTYHTDQTNENAKIKLIDSKLVYSLEEAMLQFRELLADGEEGAILKATTEKWKDGKPPWQCKLKLDISMDLKVVGFQQGTPGTKNEGKYSVILLESSDGLLTSRAGGLKESEIDFITENAESLIGKIAEVRSCGITKVTGARTSALLHPSFVQFRDDKLIADSYEECVDIESAALGILE